MADKATSGDVLNPVSDDKWMTPVRTKEMVEGITKERIGEVFSGSTNRVLESDTAIIPIIDGWYRSNLIRDTEAIRWGSVVDMYPFNNVMHFNGFSIAYLANAYASYYCIYTKDKINLVGNYYSEVGNMVNIIGRPDGENINYYGIRYTTNQSNTTLYLYRYTPTSTNARAGQTLLGSLSGVNTSSFNPWYNLVFSDTHVYFAITTNNSTNTINVYAFPISGGTPTVYTSSSLTSTSIPGRIRMYISGNFLYLHAYANNITYWLITFNTSTLNFTSAGNSYIGYYSGYNDNTSFSQVATDHGVYVSLTTSNTTASSNTREWAASVTYIPATSLSKNIVTYATAAGSSFPYAIHLKDMHDGRVLAEYSSSSDVQWYRIINKTAYSTLSFPRLSGTNYGLANTQTAHIFGDYIILTASSSSDTRTILTKIDGSKYSFLDFFAGGLTTVNIFMDDKGYIFVSVGGASTSVSDDLFLLHRDRYAVTSMLK